MTQEDLNLAALRAEQMVLAPFTLEPRFSPPTRSVDPDFKRGLNRPGSVSPAHGGHAGFRFEALIAGALEQRSRPARCRFRIKKNQTLLWCVQEFHFFPLR